MLINKPIKNGKYIFDNSLVKNSKPDYFGFIKKCLVDTTLDANLSCDLSFWQYNNKLISVKKENINDLPSINSKFKSDKKKIKQISNNLKVDPLYDDIKWYVDNKLVVRFKKLKKGEKGAKEIMSMCKRIIEKLDLLDGTYDSIHFYLPEGKVYSNISIELSKDMEKQTYVKDMDYYSSENYPIGEKTLAKAAGKILNNVKWKEDSKYK